MLSFLTRFAALVRGILCGLDRLCLVGSLRRLSYSLGFQNYLWWSGVRFKDFADHHRRVSAQLEEASLRLARQRGREIRYLNSAQHRKEDIAREIAERDRIRNGLICVLRSVDPCMSFEVRKNGATRKLTGIPVLGGNAAVAGSGGFGGRATTTSGTGGNGGATGQASGGALYVTGSSASLTLSNALVENNQIGFGFGGGGGKRARW